ncbi:MAG: AbrB/MazE/SpoVT family DNA-binding domain-containing protein [Anaerolineae bacterium]|nr:AbrB/MazE/SpoVT family DNA-binding domain-containing protein [Anaerolineae bacterium]MDW8069632.1 AbrB/MazE/SpoVT family DNA-binding domain-containing protein [Anaerolineae bacterium]
MERKLCPQFYGAVTVSERGQVVIPIQARRDLGIQIGEKLLVIGGPGGGLWLLRADLIHELMGQWLELVRQLQIHTGEDDDETGA